MFVVRFITKFDESLPHYQKSSAQVLQSTPGELGSGAANWRVNPDLICPPYILWPRCVCTGSDPSSPDPRPVVTRSQSSSHNLRRRHPSSTRRRPTLYSSSGIVYLSSPVFFLTPVLVVVRCGPVVVSYRPVVAHCQPSSGSADPLLHAAYPSLRGADPSSRPFPHSPCTHQRAPYKYARVLLFPCTLSEHPGLYLPRRLLAGFSKGCFTFFIARHPPRLEFREYSAIHSALVNLDYIEIKHYFFLSLGLLALG